MEKRFFYLAQVSSNELIYRELLSPEDCQGWDLNDRLFLYEVAVSRVSFEGRERRFRA